MENLFECDVELASKLKSYDFDTYSFLTTTIEFKGIPDLKVSIKQVEKIKAYSFDGTEKDIPFDYGKKYKITITEIQ